MPDYKLSSERLDTYIGNMSRLADKLDNTTYNVGRAEGIKEAVEEICKYLDVPEQHVGAVWDEART